jgi:hypothetical protein
MQDDVLSQAVVTFVWGDPRQSWPSSHPDTVRALFLDQAEPLLSRIDALLSDIKNIRAGSDLAAYGDRIDDVLRTNHPELDHDARKALTAKYTYSWR